MINILDIRAPRLLMMIAKSTELLPLCEFSYSSAKISQKEKQNCTQSSPIAQVGVKYAIPLHITGAPPAPENGTFLTQDVVVGNVCIIFIYRMTKSIYL